MAKRSQQLRPPARGSFDSGWHGLGRRCHAARPLALDVPNDQLTQVRGPAAAVVDGLIVEVLDVLSGELERDAAFAFNAGPAGHGGGGVCFLIIGGADAESNGVGLGEPRRISQWAP